MARKGLGVEVRANSIRLSFQYQLEQVKRTLMVNGKPLPPTPANVKYAHRLAAEIREKIRNAAFSMAEYFPADGSTHTGTFGGQLDAWLKTERIEDSTKQGYASAINFWKTSIVEAKPLGDRALRSLRLSHLLAALATRPHLKGKTVNNYVAVARDALALAVKDKIITENPAELIERASYQKPPPDPFTRAESEAIIDGATKWYPPQVANLIETWFWTGLRTSEIFGLRWPRVLLPSQRIVITEALVGGKRKSSTKTHVEREVILNSRALAALQRQRAHTQLAGEAVFRDPETGKHWRKPQDFLNHVWTPLLKRLSIRYRRPYNMRHTYATEMLMAGMLPPFCAKQLGHSVQEFLTTYAKWLDGDQNAVEMQRLEEKLSSEFSPGASLKK